MNREKIKHCVATAQRTNGRIETGTCNTARYPRHALFALVVVIEFPASGSFPHPCTYGARLNADAVALPTVKTRFYSSAWLVDVTCLSLSIVDPANRLT
jgi:hypothetical protein